jgi:hypothetical protein
MNIDMNDIEQVKKALEILEAKREILIKQLRKLIYQS